MIAVQREASVASWTSGITAKGMDIVLYTDNAANAGGPGVKLYTAGKGEDSRAYLVAILDYWDALPDAMVFMKAPSSGSAALPGGAADPVWRLNHLQWPVNEHFVSISVRRPCACLRLHSPRTQRPAAMCA